MSEKRIQLLNAQNKVLGPFSTAELLSYTGGQFSAAVTAQWSPRTPTNQISTADFLIQLELSLDPDTLGWTILESINKNSYGGILKARTFHLSKGSYIRGTWKSGVSVLLGLQG